MTERKLKKLKKAEENKILKEHEGLYARLVKENYSEAPLSATAEHPAKKRRLGWIYGLSVGAAAMLTLITVAGAFGLNSVFNGIYNKEQSTPERNPLPVYNKNVNITTVDGSLSNTSLSASGLNFKTISSCSTGDEHNYFEIEIDTFHTFDIIVQVNREFKIDGWHQNGNVKTTVNKYGFKVTYTETVRRHEDYFVFDTKAVVDTGNEVYYITYGYSSTSRESELLPMIEAYIRPKA